MKSLRAFAMGFIVILCAFLGGCSTFSDKTASISTVYAAMAILSFFMLVCYCFLARKFDAWFFVLFLSVLVVNTGYYVLSISSTIEGALTANRVSYLGSVFLPISMLFIVLRVTRIGYKKWIPYVFVSLGIVIFLIAASPGYSDIYYKQVFLEFVNGSTVLRKIYGSWHVIYLFYLLFLFSSMLCAIAYSAKKKLFHSHEHAVIIAAAVFVNIGVWFIEQMVSMDFEMLSVSYIISEMFLLGIDLVVSVQQPKTPMPATDSHQSQLTAADTLKDSHIHEMPGVSNNNTLTEKELQFEAGISELTLTERIIFNYYIQGKSTKEIMAELNIKENTLKFHNKNIYGKLGVSSRKQLCEIFEKLNK